MNLFNFLYRKQPSFHPLSGSPLRQAFQIALLKSYQDEQYAKKLIGLVYHRLRPESLRVKTGNRLVKLSSHQMEFFMLNFMIALLREITTFKIQEDLHEKVRRSFSSGPLPCGLPGFGNLSGARFFGNDGKLHKT